MIKNNIIYIGGFELPDKNAAAQRVIANAKLFRDLGYKVDLFGLSRDISETSFFDYEGFSCSNLPYPKSIGSWIKYLTSIKQYIQFIESNQPSMIVAYNHPAVALQKLSKFCKTNGIKLISDCTEWYEPQGNPIFKIIKGLDVKKRMYDVHCKLDGIIAISRYLDDFYKKRKVKTVLLPPLVDLQEAKWKYPKDVSINGPVKLIFAGSLGKGNKDRIDMVIDALDEVSKNVLTSSFTLDVLGVTEENFKKVFPNRQSTPSFVTFHGRVSHQDVVRMLIQSDFQIFIREKHLANEAGFPTKFVESISSQTLVLTNSSSNMCDYMKDGVNGYLLNITSFNELVESLINSLRLSKQEIFERRQNMDVTLFDYRKYIPAMKNFLSSL